MRRKGDIDAFLSAEPAWRVVSDSDDGSTVLEGPAVVLGSTEKRYPFVLRMEVPATFPATGADPLVTVLESPVPLGDDAHVNASGALCVQMPPAHEIDYARGGLVGFFVHVIVHLRRSVIYSLIGEFPGPAYAHGEKGKAEFRDELVASFPLGLRRFVQPGLPLPPDNMWCPCGERTRFGSCHKPRLKAAQVAYLQAGGCARVPFRNRVK